MVYNGTLFNNQQNKIGNMKNKELNIDKVLILVEDELDSSSYHCPYPEGAALLEKIQSLRSADNLEWIEQAAHYYTLYSHLLTQEKGSEFEYSKKAHKLYSWMCEGSLYLQTVFPDRVEVKRKEMEQCMDSLRNRLSALKLIEENQAVSFLSNMLSRLKASNYVLYPARRAETLFYFMAYDDRVLKTELGLVAEILYLMKENGLMGSSVNAHIQKLLKQEIDQYEEIIAGLWFTEAQRVLETKILEAVGLITLALLNSDNPAREDISPQILSARICRYMSRLDTPLSTQLKNKAYTMLTNESTLEGRISWNELLNFEPDHFMRQLVNIHIEELNAPSRIQDNKWEQYSNGHNTLTLDKDGFTLSPLFPYNAHSWRGRKDKASLMDNRVFIALFSKPTYQFGACRDIADLQLYWHQLAEDYPLCLSGLPAVSSMKIAEQAQMEHEEDGRNYPETDESITVGIIGLHPSRQCLEGVVLDEAYRGQKAILPLTQINECYSLIPDFEQHFSNAIAYKVKVMEKNSEGIRVSLAQSYNEFIYAENVQRKTMPAMIAECEGNKIKWLLITGGTCITPGSRWIKPKIGDMYQVEFRNMDNRNSKPALSPSKVKADISKEEFYEELHRHLQEFADCHSNNPNRYREREQEKQLLKHKNNPLVTALQKLDLTSVVTAREEAPSLYTHEEEDTDSLERSNVEWLNGQTAEELLFCLDQLAKDLDDPCDQFNIYNFLRLLCLFSGKKDTATYYELCADYLYAINQMGTQPFGERLAQGNIERFNILLARMEQLGIKQYGITFEFCKNVISVLCSMANSDNRKLQLLVKSEDKTVSGLARYFSMLALLSEKDYELQSIIYKNINNLLGIKESKKKESPAIPVCFGFEGVEREFKSSAFVRPKEAGEDQSTVLARVIASFMNTDGGTLYIGVNDLGYLIGICEDLKFVHNDCDVYLRTVNRNIICLLGEGKEDFNRYQEYIRCDFHEYGRGRLVLAFRVPPVNEVVKVGGKVYTRSGSSCICKPGQNVSEFAAVRRSMKLDSVPRKPEFPTFFSEERNEYIFDEKLSASVTVLPVAADAGVPAVEEEEMSLPLFKDMEQEIPVVSPVASKKTADAKRDEAPKKAKVELNVLTSSLRPNPLQKRAELGYNSNYTFVSIFGDGKIACSPSPRIGVWGKDKVGKVFFSYDMEGNEDLLVSVFTTGEVGVSNLKKGFSAPNSPVAFTGNINKLLFCSPASREKFLLLVAVKNEDKRYRIIRLCDFERSMSIQPRLTLTLVPDKGEYIFAEILDEEMMRTIEDDKVSLDSFDEYNAGRIWEHTTYKNGLKKISELCHLPY